VEQGLCLSAGEMSRILPNMAVYIPDMTGYNYNNTGYLLLFEFEFKYSAFLIECTMYLHIKVCFAAKYQIPVLYTTFKLQHNARCFYIRMSLSLNRRKSTLSATIVY
jgi:hypothetical protein